MTFSLYKNNCKKKTLIYSVLSTLVIIILGIIVFNINAHNYLLSTEKEQLAIAMRTNATILHEINRLETRALKYSVNKNLQQYINTPSQENQNEVISSFKNVLNNSISLNSFVLTNSAGECLLYIDNKEVEKTPTKNEFYYYNIYKRNNITEAKATTSWFISNYDNAASAIISIKLNGNDKDYFYFLTSFPLEEMSSEIDLIDSFSSCNISIVDESENTTLNLIKNRELSKETKFFDKIKNSIYESLLIQSKFPVSTTYKIDEGNTKNILILTVTSEQEQYLELTNIFQTIFTIVIILIICFSVIIYLISYLVQSNNTKKNSLLILKNVIDQSINSIMICDKDLKIIYSNYITTVMFNKKTHHFLGINLLEYLKEMMTGELVYTLEKEVKLSGRWEGNINCKANENQKFHGKLIVTKISNKNNAAYAYIATFSDITYVNEKLIELNDAISLDPLTKLPNRHKAIEELNKIIFTSSKNNNAFAVVSLTIENLKINRDIHGYRAGDIILKAFSERVQKYLLPTNYFARIEENQFIIIIEYDDFQIFYKKLSELIESAAIGNVTFEEHEIPINLKSGIAIFPEDGKTSENLIKSANMASHETGTAANLKKINFYTDTLSQKNWETLKIIDNLKNAINENELYLVFQPKVDVNSNSIYGAEALLRWNSKKLGIIAPSIFIPIAEQSGIITNISRWIIDELLKKIIKWQQMNLKIVPISINLTSEDFLENDFIEESIQKMKHNGITGQNIEIEITEYTLLEDKAKVKREIDSLSKNGYKVYIDDFGLGFSSLNYLKTFKIGGIKIPREFIMGYPENDDGSIAKTIVDVSTNLNLHLIAEGVETKQQADFLISIGCNIQQGYYYFKPMLENEFENLLKDKKLNLF